jgi:hypothetical protein
MTRTARLDLPLLQAAQAQKHVTVNDALSRLDGLCQMTLEAVDTDIPPPSPQEGQAWAVGAAAQGDWEGQSGRVAFFVNGGWIFALPRIGWRAWLRAAGTTALFDGAAWQGGACAVSLNGAGTVAEVVEADVPIVPGGSTDTVPLIPAGSVVQAITGRVLTDLAGGAVSWRLGVAGSEDRYGTGYGLTAGSWARGLTGQPQAYWSDTPLRISAEGGVFSDGLLRLAIHLTRFTLPRE